MRRQRAFTLIELVIVVAIMSMLAAVLVPALLHHRPSRLPAPPEGETSVLKEADLRLELHRESASRFRLAYAGNFTVEAPSRLNEIPLPADCELRNLQLTLNGKPSEDYTLTTAGLFYSGQGRAELHFEAIGPDRLALVPPRSRHLTVELAYDGGMLSSDSLPPTASEPGLARWAYGNMLSERPLLLDLPGQRVQLLCRLVGLAVALFGLGFWYLGDLYRPGLLGNFRWGSFFLLALTYSFFFPSLAVLTLSEGMDLVPALLLAAGLSLPLLMLHVGRVADFRFAFGYVLPLTLGTLGMVVNGVFGEGRRDLVYLGAGFLVVSFLTLSYRRWAQHRRQVDLLAEQALLERASALGDQVEEARLLLRQASEPALVKPLAELRQQADEAAICLQEASELPRLAPKRRGERREQLGWRCDTLERNLPRSLRNVRLSLQHLEEERSRRSQGAVFCMQCARAAPDSACCPHCGVRRPRRWECACGCRLLLAGEDLGGHCPGCGTGLDPAQVVGVAGLDR